MRTVSPRTQPLKKRRIELAMSGVSYCLLLGFTIYFIISAYGDAQMTSDDNSGGECKRMGDLVLVFAVFVLLFDCISALIAHVRAVRFSTRH